MIMHLYALKDKLNGFGQVLTDTNDDTAKRNFIYGIQNNPQLLANVEDFDLYLLGAFDQENGTFEIETIPKIVITGSDVRSITERRGKSDEVQD